MKFKLEGIKTFQALVKELALGLRLLSFENFQGFETTITIPATSELSIRNELTFIPSRYIILSQTGNGLITKGTTNWDSNFIYLYNNGAVTVTATIQFLR